LAQDEEQMIFNFFFKTIKNLFLRKLNHLISLNH